MTTPWTQVPIGEVADPVSRPETPVPGQTYRQVGVRLWGEGAYERGPLDGGSTRYKTLNRTELHDIIVNKIWARSGSVSVILDGLDGCYCSGEFPLFQIRQDKLDPRWFYWITKTSWFWDRCDIQSRGTSGKNRIRPERFLAIQIPLPSLPEQRRMAARVDQLAGKVAEARSLRAAAQTEGHQLLLAAFYRVTAGAPRRGMGVVAPVVRRPIRVRQDLDYPELGIRSFGKGTFHKPALPGIMVRSKKLFEIRPGDLVFNNVFAWEGAVAVAQNADIGRCGSHRFITCVPQDGVAISEFLCFYFLIPEGLEQLRKASPGGAGRNRTLGLTALSEIEVPIPPLGTQLWFDDLRRRIDWLERLEAEAAGEIDALLPSILDKAFRGQL